MTKPMKYEALTLKHILTWCLLAGKLVSFYDIRINHILYPAFTSYTTSPTTKLFISFSECGNEFLSIFNFIIVQTKSDIEVLGN